MSNAHNIVTLTAPLRIRPAEGEASFFNSAGLHFENNYEAQWLHLPEGTVLELVGGFAKTDTFLYTVTTPELEDEETGEVIPALMTGMVLRLASHEKIVALAAAVDGTDTDKEA